MRKPPKLTKGYITVTSDNAMGVRVDSNQTHDVQVSYAGSGSTNALIQVLSGLEHLSIQSISEPMRLHHR